MVGFLDNIYAMYKYRISDRASSADTSRYVESENPMTDPNSFIKRLDYHK
jgi:hypothetical protein